MQINIISNQQPAFGSLITDKTVKDVLKKRNCSKTLLNRFKGIRKYVWSEKLSSKDNVDIRLKYTENDGFYGLISSKKNNFIPYQSADCKCRVSPLKDSLENFKQWVNKWDSAFSDKS